MTLVNSFHYCVVIVSIWTTIYNVTLVSLCYGMCPFARMMNQYNFSGEWIMAHPDNGDKYLMHVCHPLGNEIFFGISKLEEPEWLIGFGGGNWSQWNSGIGGIKYMLNGENDTVDESGFIVTMDTDGHDWYMKDLQRQYALDIKSEVYSTHEICGVPYGYNKRVERNFKIRNVLKKKRYIPREIERREKKIKKLEARNPNGEKDEKISKIKVEIEELKVRPVEPMTEEQDPNLVIVPTLYGKTFASDSFIVTFLNNNTLCMNNITAQDHTSTTHTVSNVSSWYGETAFRSNWEASDGQFGTQFYMLFDQGQVYGSHYIMSEEKHRGYSFVLSEVGNERSLDCPSNIVDTTTEMCETCSNGEQCPHCEL